MLNKVKESKMVKNTMETAKCAIKIVKVGLILCIIWGTYTTISTNMENGAENIFTAFMGDGSPSRSLTPVEDTTSDNNVENDYSNNENVGVINSVKESYDEKYVTGLEMASYMNDYLFNACSSRFTDLTAEFHLNDVDMDNAKYMFNFYLYDASSSDNVIDVEVSVDFVDNFEDIVIVFVDTNKAIAFKDFIYDIINIPNE